MGLFGKNTTVNKEANKDVNHFGDYMWELELRRVRIYDFLDLIRARFENLVKECKLKIYKNQEILFHLATEQYTEKLNKVIADVESNYNDIIELIADEYNYEVQIYMKNDIYYIIYYKIIISDIDKHLVKIIIDDLKIVNILNIDEDNGGN